MKKSLRAYKVEIKPTIKSKSKEIRKKQLREQRKISRKYESLKLRNKKGKE